MLFTIMAAKGQTINVQITASYANGNAANCFGESSASITSAVSGGYAPYTYRWSNDQTTSSIANVPAGYYKLIVRDANGVEGWDEITVAQYSPLELSAIISNYNNGHNISCNNCANGTITLTVIGGATPYTYQWNDGNTNGNRTNLSSNSYEVTITDAAGCELRSERYYLTEPERSDWTMTGNNNTNPTTHFIGTADFKDLVFRTNNAERMQITSEGKLKIKKFERTNPGLDLLFVNEKGEVEVGPVNCAQALNFPWFLGGNYFGANSTASERQIGTCTNHELAFITNTFERGRFTENGNLGIGTTSPQSKVAVNGNVAVGNAYAGVNAPTNGLIVEGKVGIGTSTVNALAILQLKGSAPNFYITDNGAASTSINLQNNDGFWHISGPRSNEAGKPLSVFWNNNTNFNRLLSILNDGTVAIGIDPAAITLQNGTTPYKLLVNGKLGANEIWTSLGAPWPDYVFEPHHKYLSLDELQNYTVTKKHLPGMPNAQDIETNGKLNVTQTLIQQQEKLEEAYLYIFELKKEIDALKLLLKK